MAPPFFPAPLNPPVIVSRVKSIAVSPGAVFVAKTRRPPPPLIVLPFAWPTIDTGLVMLYSVPVIVTVPGTLNVIVSAAASALAKPIASRNEPAPPSLTFVTVNAAGVLRSSSAVRWSRFDRCGVRGVRAFNDHDFGSHAFKGQ